MADQIRLLIIDDDEVDRKTVVRLFKNCRENYEVRESATLEEALEQIQTYTFHCILLDYQMPGRDGLEVLHQFKAQFFRTPVIFMTGQGDEMLVVRALRAGAADYLPKDKLSAELLEHSISNVIRIFDLEQRAHQAERELNEKELRYRLIVETVSDLIFHIDKFGNILYANPAVEKLGYRCRELVGHSILELIMGSEHASLLSRSKILNRRQGDRATRNLEIDLRIHPDALAENSPTKLTFLMDVFGLWEPASAQESAENRPAHFLGSLAVARNISDRKRYETKLKEFTTELQRSNRDLQEFAYIASHDLQEPLRKIQLFGDRLAKHLSPVPPQTQEYLSRMQSAAQRMQTFIHELLELSRVTTRSNPFSPLNLNELALKVWEELDDEEPKKLELGQLPALNGDPIQIRQLFQNLLSNAIKFKKPEGTCFVRIWADQADNGDWVIKIRDNGIGFDPQYAERIFRPFERLHGNYAFHGTGMGLAISRKIIDRHRGAIWAESVPGEGSTFFLRISPSLP